ATNGLREGDTGPNGLVVGCHAYTVVGYNATTQMVQLRNPWGRNDPYSYQVEVSGRLGGNGPVTRQSDGLGNVGGVNGNGRFWLTLPQFRSMFQELAYEQP